MKLKEMIKKAFFALCILATGSAAHAQTGPETAVNAAIAAVSDSAESVINTSGGIIVTLAILAGLWALGARWVGKAAAGRKG